MHQARVRYEQGKLRQEITIGRHHLVADEPVELGGEDTGPTPLDYLAASLAACTAITLRMYAQRKGWPLENTDVTVTLETRDDATMFTRELKLSGGLNEEQRGRLLDIANKCPVHKALSGRIRITTAALTPG